MLAAFEPSTATRRWSFRSASSRKRPCAIGTNRTTEKFGSTPRTSMEVFDQALTSYKSFRFNVAVTERNSGSLRISASSRKVSLYGRMAVCWLGNAGIVASKVITTSLPILARLRRWPLRNPSPRPTRTSSEPTPQAMPNMVRNVRSLLAIMARKTSPRMSPKFCIGEPRRRKLALRRCTQSGSRRFRESRCLA